MKQNKSLLELAKDLELLAKDMKEANDNFFKNMFGFTLDLKDKSQESAGLMPDSELSPEDEKAADEELEFDGSADKKLEELDSDSLENL